MNIRLILITFILFQSIVPGLFFGDYQKDYFYSNENPLLWQAYRLLEKEVKKQFTDKDSIYIKPLIVYHQLVNGINFNMIIIQKDSRYPNKPVLYEGVVYTGPAQNREFSITYWHSLPDVESTVDDQMKSSFLLLISSLYQKTKYKINQISSISAYPMMKKEENLYIVTVEITDNVKDTHEEYHIIHFSDKGIDIVDSTGFLWE